MIRSFPAAALLVAFAALPWPGFSQTGAPVSANPANPGAERTPALGERLRERIESTDWEGGALSILVQDADSPLIVLERNADQPVPPGPLAQLATAAAALDLLGPAYRFPTELAAVSPDTEAGQAYALVVRGNGDPAFSLKYLKDDDALWAPFDRWAATLKQRNIKRVNNGIFADASAFDSVGQPPGWPADRAGDPRYPVVSALNFNSNALQVRWHPPRRAGEEAQAELFPKLEGFAFFSSDVRTAEHPRLPRTYLRVANGNHILATGDIAPRERAVDWAGIGEPPLYFAEALRQRLIAKGIKIEGPAAMLGPEQTFEPTPLDVMFSPPLREIVQGMFAGDGTLEAEVLFKTLGKRMLPPGVPATFAAGAAAMQDYAVRQRAPDPFTALVDGSGLSPLSRLTARQILHFMAVARRSPAGVPLEELLARPGDGDALAGRLAPPTAEESGKDQPASLESTAIAVRYASLPGFEGAAGQLLAPGGMRLDFVVMVHGSRTPPPILQRRIDLLLIDLMQ